MKRQILLLGMVVALLSACATSQPATVQTGNPEQLVSQLEADLTAGRSSQLDVLAPNWFNKAESSFAKAKSALEKGSKLSAIGKYVAEGNSSLKKAEEIARVSRTILGDTNEARQKALDVGADKLGKPYLDVEKQYLKLTDAIENDNMSYAQKNAATVQQAFRDVEIMAIKNNELGDIRHTMAEAEAAKLQKIAPTAYADAEQSLLKADTYIGQNPYAADANKQIAAEAGFMAQRMMSVSDSSSKLQEMNPEDSAIYLESLLARLSKTMNAGDLRNKSVEAQVDTLTGAAKNMINANQSLKAENQGHQAKIANLEQRLAGLQGFSREQEQAKKKLAAEREFNERFNQVQRYFRSDEAEVYKQGSQLVIRMRGIKFPVGQATLTTENYTLLSKVQKAIRTFGQPTVTIEGHTDSTGSAQMNQELSQKRAEAVKSYLVANNTLSSNRIRATGYGPDRPLAPNTTEQGRSINRRIDVLITPSATP